MPFDALDQHGVAVENHLYRQRRENAVARWKTVPREQFDMDNWYCGTRACALGWLGVWRHDGWRLHDTGLAIAPRYGDVHDTFRSAAIYFGISFDDALVLFRGGRKITAEEVGNILLWFPYHSHCDWTGRQIN